MAQWYVKDLSKLTGISVQTLHHYDRIGLLRPSVRLDNGYRLYSEPDLWRLQRIIALKFFGFGLDQIKTLLAADVDIMDHFRVQAQLLSEKANALIDASKMLNDLMSSCNRSESIPWETIISLIESYRMTQQLEHAWVGKILSPEELKNYVRFEEGLKERFTLNEKKTFEQAWAAVVAEIQTHLKQDPTSEFGMALGKRCMDLVNTMYGPEHAELKHSIWEKGYKQGKMEGEHFLSPEVIEWMDKAIDAYYRTRLYALLDQVGSKEAEQLAQQWEAIMHEMFGNSKPLRQDLVQMALEDTRVSEKAKAWLRDIEGVNRK